jgi:isocitrate/isopropylmalate dehydrogenase
MANRYDVVLLPGDGIGREIAVQARRVLERVESRLGVAFAIDEVPCGGQTPSTAAIAGGPEERCRRRCRAARSGGLASPDGSGSGDMLTVMAGYSAETFAADRSNVRLVKLFEGVHIASPAVTSRSGNRKMRYGVAREHRGPVFRMGGTPPRGERHWPPTWMITRAASERDPWL